MNCIFEAKNDFYSKLNKGKVLKFNELNIITDEENFHHYNQIIQNWYYQIKDLNFLPTVSNEIEEIAIHSPTEIKLKYNNRTSNHDCDLTQEDLEASFEILAINYKQDWNYSNPFCSFHGVYNERSVRFTLIHKSASSKEKSKLFIRFLNQELFSISDYTDQEERFKMMIQNKKNILIAGATGSGKTTFANTLIDQVPINEHIVIIEDTQELISRNAHTTFFITHPNNLKKTMNSYLSYSLRISPDRIILGELRSAEVESALLAMNTGHNGFISTIHANSAKDSIHRIALLFKLYSKHNLDYNYILKLITSNIDYIIYLENKKIKEVIEVYGSEGDQIFFDQIN